ncbi:MAG TPA: methionyl-tRNA formyltransferase [Allosphingosinicella sp.]|jgi:methionyl-tRNA formyltransferase|nr:methionyl-tRNA formyltransferase [Allosphingosinicella sp.]
MNVAFLGTTRFGLRCLEALARLPDCRLVGAIAAPPTFPISYRPEGVTNVLHADVPAFCEANGLPCLLVRDGMRDEGLLGEVERWRPQALVVAGWFHMLPKKWRDLAPAYGLHASLLPDYSGGAPLVWAMINGERRTGITLFQLAGGVDDGPIVGQAATDISADDTIGTLYARIETLGVALLEQHVPLLAQGRARLEPQDERLRRTFPQRGPEDGLIDWTWPAARIHDFVRAQTRPYPGAFTRLGQTRVTVWATRLTDDAPLLALGEYAGRDGRLFAGAGVGALELLEVEAVGERLGAGGRFG